MQGGSEKLVLGLALCYTTQVKKYGLHWKGRCMKKILTLSTMILLLISISFSGCGNEPEIDSASTYVQGILDTIYLGEQSSEFLAITKVNNPSQLEEEYENGIKAEVDYFSYYFNLDSASAAFEEELTDMYKSIYQHSKYQVQPSIKTDETFYVDVVISPIDVIYKVVEEDLASYIESFRAASENGELDGLTEEEYNNLYASGIIELVQKRIQNLGYYEDQTVTVEVVAGSEDGLYYIHDNSLAEIDAIIIKY